MKLIDISYIYNITKNDLIPIDDQIAGFPPKDQFPTFSLKVMHKLKLFYT